MKSNNELVEYLISNGALKTLEIIRAFSKIDRKEFMDPKFKSRAYEDSAFPIGYGQTISQPTTVAFMIEILKPERGQKILDIGTGSGYAAAILAKIVGEKGKVITTEIIPALREKAKENLEKFKFDNIELYQTNGSQGFPKEAPFDRIISACAPEKVPESLKNQLNEKGRLVMPVGRFVQSIVLIRRKGAAFVQKEYPGFMFVPMIKKDD